MLPWTFIAWCQMVNSMESAHINVSRCYNVTITTVCHHFYRSPSLALRQVAPVTVMRKDGDKISIRMDADGHYVFYSFRDELDHG